MMYTGKVLSVLKLSKSYNELGIVWVVEDGKRVLVYKDSKTGMPTEVEKVDITTYGTNVEDNAPDIFMNVEGRLGYSTISVQTPSGYTGRFLVATEYVSHLYTSPHSLYKFFEKIKNKVALGKAVRNNIDEWEWRIVSTIRV